MINVSFLSILLIVELTSFSTLDAQYISQENDEKIYLIVDKNGNGDYTSIQEAIDNAFEETTIYIKPGVYSEIISIRKKVNLIGEDKENVIINPISEENKYAVRLGAPGISISYLCITNGAPGIYSTGIYISLSNINIKNCNFYNNPIGIAIWTSNNSIENCSFWGCTDEGIALLGSKYSNCENNKIINCKFYDNCDGIELQYSSNNIIANCEFYNNTHSGIDAISSNNDNNLITGCKIYNNRVHGIYLSSSSENQIIDCSIENNKDGNIIITKNSNNNVINECIQNDDLEEDNLVIDIPSDNNILNGYNNLELNRKKVIEQIYNILSNLKILKIINYFTNF